MNRLHLAAGLGLFFALACSGVAPEPEAPRAPAATTPPAPAATSPEPPPPEPPPPPPEPEPPRSYPIPTLDCPPGTSQVGGPYPERADRWWTPPDCALPEGVRLLDALGGPYHVDGPDHDGTMREGDAHWMCARADGTPHGPYLRADKHLPYLDDAWWVFQGTFREGMAEGAFEGHVHVQGDGPREPVMRFHMQDGAYHGAWELPPAPSYDKGWAAPCPSGSGEYVRGARHGEWTHRSTDELDSPQLTLSYVRGVPQGPAQRETAAMMGWVDIYRGTFRDGFAEGTWAHHRGGPDEWDRGLTRDDLPQTGEVAFQRGRRVDQD